MELEGHQLIVHVPVWLEFDGIAKGYAVDLAVAALRRAGRPAGVINAGDDLRVFGGLEEAVLVRSLFDAAGLWPIAGMRDSACAMSASGAVLPREALASEAPPRRAPRRCSRPPPAPPMRWSRSCGSKAR